MTRVEGVRNFLLQSEKRIGYGRQRDTLKTYKEKDGKAYLRTETLEYPNIRVTVIKRSGKNPEQLDIEMIQILLLLFECTFYFLSPLFRLILLCYNDKKRGGIPE